MPLRRCRGAPGRARGRRRPLLHVVQPAPDVHVRADLVLARRQADRERQQEGGQADHQQQRDQEGGGGGAGHAGRRGHPVDRRGRHRAAVHLQRRHAGVVHPGDRDAHDQRRADGRPMPVTQVPIHSATVPATIAITTDSATSGSVVGHGAGHVHRRHAQVVHAGHADAEDHAAGQPAGPARRRRSRR